MYKSHLEKNSRRGSVGSRNWGRPSCKAVWWDLRLASLLTHLLPAALRAAQTCRYLVYSEADFEVFRPAGATCCTDRGEIWHGSPSSVPNFTPIGATTRKFLLRFDQNVEYKCPAGAYPLRDFHKICRVCTSFLDALGAKIWLDLLKGLWSYGGFKLMVSGCCQIFSGP